MEWTWAFVTAVVPDVEAASAFYTGALGLPELGTGEFSAIGAEGRLFGLGTNASVAVVHPTTAGRARQLLDQHRGGLCHLGVATDRTPPVGETVRSPLGEGRMVTLAGELAIEIQKAGPAQLAPAAPTSIVAELDHVAAVVPDLDGATARLHSLGFVEDPEASHWEFLQLRTRNVVFPSRSGYLEINRAFGSDGVFGSLAAARGAGIVGLTLTVANMDDAVGRLREEGVVVSDPGPVLARTPQAEERDLGLSAVVSMKSSFGARLFLFAPSRMAPHYGSAPARSTEA